MRKVVISGLFVLFLSSSANATSLYEVVAGDEDAMVALLAAGGGLKSMKVSGGLDLESEDGTTFALNLEFEWIGRPWPNDCSISYGPVAAVTLNDEKTAWKAGGFARLEFPVVRERVGPYLRLAGTYEDPGGEEDAAAVGTAGVGVSFLLGQEGCKKSALEIEAFYKIASEELFADDAGREEHDWGMTFGIRVFF
jgi:hypothetical protein